MFLVDDFELLRSARPDVHGPSPEAAARARARVFAEADTADDASPAQQHRRRRRPLGARAGVRVAVAAGILTVATAAVLASRAPDQPSTTTAEDVFVVDDDDVTPPERCPEAPASIEVPTSLTGPKDGHAPALGPLGPGERAMHWTGPGQQVELRWGVAVPEGLAGSQREPGQDAAVLLARRPQETPDGATAITAFSAGAAGTCGAASVTVVAAASDVATLRDAVFATFHRM